MCNHLSFSSLSSFSFPGPTEAWIPSLFLLRRTCWLWALAVPIPVSVIPWLSEPLESEPWDRWARLPWAFPAASPRPASERWFAVEGGDAPASPLPQRQPVAHQLFIGHSEARLCHSVETLILQVLYFWL